MKKQMLYFIAMSMMIFLFSCASGGHKKDITSTAPVKEELIHINLPATGENKLNVSEFADTVIYVPLETNSQSFLRRIVQLQLTDKYIFINGFDRLLLFSKEGKFIRQIGRKGKGPGEYTFIFNFIVIQDTVFISSSYKRSLIKYTVNGDFLEEQPTSSQLARFNTTPDNRIVWYNQDKGNLVFFDRKLTQVDTISVDYNVSPERSTYSWWDDFDTYFQKSEHRLLFANYMSDTIWDISNGQKEIGYVLNLGKQLLPEDYRVEYSQGDFERFKRNATPYQKINLFETSSFLFLFQKGWIDKEINSTYLHDRSANTIRRFDSPAVFDDLVGKVNLSPDYTSNNCIIATINPVELIDELKKDQKQEKTDTGNPSPEWLKQMEKVRENDNQVLVIMPVRK